MASAKITEMMASSTESFDDALKKGIARAHKTIKNLRAARIENQTVELSDDGSITAYRVMLEITFMLEE